MDTPEEIRLGRVLQEMEEEKWGRRDYCDRDCPDHNENCPYYDADEESWDTDMCYKEQDWWEDL